MKKIIFFFTSIILLLSCNNKKAIDKTININFSNLKVEELTPEVENKYLSPPTYIKLKSDSAETDFKSISQIKIINDKIYILDRRMKSLLVYDINGTALGKVGTKGQGPEEYIQIGCFDVDDNGNIYFVDGHAGNDRLFIFDKDYKFVSLTKMPFQANSILKLKNGNYMFALSSWNNGIGKGMKVAIMDSMFNISKTFIPYDEYIDENFWISDYDVIRSYDRITYYQPIDNNIYTFSLTGDSLERIHVDFGNKDVPLETRKDIEKHINDFDNYYVLKEFTVVTPKFIAGTLWMNKENKVFILDKEKNTIYLSKKYRSMTNPLLTGFNDSIWISYIDPDSYLDLPQYASLPKDVINHMENGNDALCIRRIK